MSASESKQAGGAAARGGREARGSPRGAAEPRPAGPARGPRPAGPAPNAQRTLVYALLAAAVALVAYLPAVRNGFVNWDDNVYVTENPHVRGLSWETARWAFTTFYQSNWHPLTWLSHAADGSLFGPQARGHHTTSVLLHAANAGLLVLVLSQLTGSPARSLLVGALFALHPLNVESVAWIAERKNVLSTLFWLLAMGAHVRYARRPSPARYAAVGLFFVLGLLSKPMLVTLPAALLLLDAWPLRRFSRRAVVEKLPFFVLSAAASAVTIAAQRAGGALQTIQAVPIGLRLANAAHSLVVYLEKAVWPAGLSVIVSFPGSVEAPRLPVATVAACAAAAAAVTAGVVLARRKAPQLAFGWFWYVVTLLPVIGLVQVGDQARADRYAYVPLIGVFVAVAWSLPDASRSAARRAAVVGASLVAAALLGVATARRCDVWKDSESLWRATLAVNPRALEARNNYGHWLLGRNRVDEAMMQFREVIRVAPDHPRAHVNLGVALQETGRLEESAAELERGLRVRPGDADALYNLAITRARQGRGDDARALLAEALAHREEGGGGAKSLAAESAAGASARHLDSRRDRMIASCQDADSLYNLSLALTWLEDWGGALAALDASSRLRPDHVPTIVNRGVVLGRMGRGDEAIAAYRDAVARDPKHVEAWMNLASALAAAGRDAEAAAAFRTLRELTPLPGRLALAFGWILAASPDDAARDGATAVAIAERLVEATGRKDARALDLLGAAYAETGRFDEAGRAAQSALATARAAGDSALALAIEGRAGLYARGAPCRSPAGRS